ncbi:MAG: HAD family hydrolase [Candidatus Tectimicrobiota bacterium]
MVQAIVCDFDYTLADSSPGIIACANEALRGLGFPQAPAARIRSTIGLSLPQTLAALTGVTDAAMASEFTRRFVAHADQVMNGLTTLYPWVPETVQHLRQRGVRLGIVSSKYRYRIEQILQARGLAACFEVIVGGEDVVYHKPDPAGLFLAIERLQVAPAQVLYVGDHPVDAEAASRAGIAFMAVLTGTSDAQSFANHPVRHFLPDLSQLPLRLSSQGFRLDSV